MNIVIQVAFGAFLYILIFVAVSLPLTTHASVLSFLSGLFSSPTASAQVALPNSQNIALLEAPHSPNPDVASSKNNLAILDGTSLSPETEPVASTAVVGNINTDQISLYVVHQGDTLPAIAKMFGVSVNTIVWANNIKGNKVSVGDKLVILPISGVQYSVKSGDTLLSIAKKYKGDVDEIAQFNNLATDAKLAVGQAVIIPDGEVSASESGPVQAGGNGNNGSSGGTTVHVSPGGTSPLASGALPAPAGSPVVGSVGPNYPVFVGYYERPILGGVKTQGIHGHNGVDLSSSYGTSIMAAADGEVIVSRDSGWNGGYGSYVVIKHDNGTQTLYAHLSATLVNVGDEVAQGQVIARMGSTGDSTGTHLHFEIRGAQNPF